MNHYTVLKSVFASIAQSPCNLYAVRINHETNGGLSYGAHCVMVRPEKSLRVYLGDVCAKYMTGTKPNVTEASDFLPYDAQTLGEQDIFVANKSNECVAEGCRKLLAAIDDPDVEHEATELHPNAMAIGGTDQDGKRILLLSVHAPFALLKHRFRYFDHGYQAILDPILTLSTNIDAVICDQTIYLLSASGAQVFVSDSICKKIANERVNRLQKLKFVHGLDVLRDISQKGPNPKRFLAYSESRVKQLADPRKCREIMKKFSIPYANGSADVSNPADAEKFIKIICNRGMEDPFEKKPVEVSGSKAWRISGKRK